MDAKPFKLSGSVPVVEISSLATGIGAAASAISDQLTNWGFMAVEVPGISEPVSNLLSSFSSACASTAPTLADYAYTSVPQLSSGGNHGYFPFFSEVPRLAQGVADPKEHIHISGAMLENRPSGAGDVLRAFPALGAAAGCVFNIAFDLVSLFGEVIRGMMPNETPALGLSRDASNLRIVHYREGGNRRILAHEHSGIQMLGLQLPPTDQGLQYVLHDGTWVEPLIANTDIVLCNIGRMLTKASNDRFRPSTHRVHRSSEQPGYERLSSVLFAYPAYEDHQWVVSNEGLTFLNETWGDFIKNRFAGLSNGAD
jgi:hypothetical protein